MNPRVGCLCLGKQTPVGAGTSWPPPSHLSQLPRRHPWATSPLRGGLEGALNPLPITGNSQPPLLTLLSEPLSECQAGGGEHVCPTAPSRWRGELRPGLRQQTPAPIVLQGPKKIDG